MNQNFWSGFTAATLLITTLGIAPLSSANQPRSEDEVSEAHISPTEGSSANQVASTSPEPSASQSEAVKVGEYQSEEHTEPEETITEIFPHEVEGRQAVTLYVRDIPVLTFLGSAASANNSSESTSGSSSSAEVKVASVQNHSSTHSATERSVARPQQETDDGAGTENAENDSSDPVWRATAISARLNQLYRDNVDASSITAAWDPERQRYLIKVGEDELVEIDQDTVLPNSTQDAGEDALQATNLLRRQLGDAPPLQSVSGDPQNRNSSQVSLGSFQFSISGMASWYGPGFDGNYSASGEVFNQHDLTAAHRTLPFGTQVRVTNLDNGLSVVVRINDRGPFHGNRVIDLSTAAAQAIGLVQVGVAPVTVEVLGTTSGSAQN